MQLAFITYEFWPTTPGGAGVLLYHAVRQALKDGYRVHLIIDTDGRTFSQLHSDVAGFENSQNLHCHLVETSYPRDAPSPENFCSEVFFRSFRFACALESLHAQHPFDYVEFFDYNGPAYYTLINRMLRPERYPKKISVRAHNTIEIISERTGYGVHPTSFFNFVAERQSCFLADGIITPSTGFFEAEFRHRYDLTPEQMVIGTPYCEKMPSIQSRELARDVQIIIFYGRLSTLKGLDTFLTAAELLLRQRDEGLEFHIIGPTEHVVGGVLEQLDRMKSIFGQKIKVIGKISREDLPHIFQNATCAVFPNRSESFCYAAHEVFQLGVPLVINDIAGFRSFFDDRKTALFFNGTAHDLSTKLAEILNDSELRDKLSNRSEANPTRYSGTPYNEIFNGVRPFTQISRPSSIHITVVVLSERRVFNKIWRDVIVPPNVAADFIVLSRAKEEPAQVRVFSQDYVLEPISTLSSLFSPLSSSDIVLTRDLGSLDLGAITRVFECARSALALVGEASFGKTVGPGTASALDLQDYAPLCTDNHKWIGLCKSPIETLFDLQHIFGQMTFSKPFGMSQFKTLRLPVVTLPGRALTTQPQSIARARNIPTPGPIGQTVAHWREFSQNHPRSITIVNLATDENPECWAVDVTSRGGQVTYRGTPVAAVGNIDFVPATDAAGRLASAAYVKAGALTYYEPKGGELRLLMHPYSSEVLIFHQGRSAWLQLRSPASVVVDVSVNIRPEDDILELTIIPAWPQDVEIPSSYQPSTRVALASLAAAAPTETAYLNFTSDEEGSPSGLSLEALLQLTRASRSSELRAVLTKAFELGIQHVRCRLPGSDLDILPDLLNSASSSGEFSSNPVAMTFMIDDFPFFSAEHEEFRSLQHAIDHLIREKRVRWSVETPSLRLAQFLRRCGIPAQLVRTIWPSFGLVRARGGNNPSERSIVVLSSHGVVRTTAHMLIAVGMSNIVDRIELWNAPLTDLDIEALFPHLTIIPKSGELKSTDIEGRRALLTVYPEQRNLRYLRLSASAGVPFLTGSSNDGLLSTSPLRDVATCPYWEDSNDIARMIPGMLDSRQFASVYDAARLSYQGLSD